MESKNPVDMSKKKGEIFDSPSEKDSDDELEKSAGIIISGEQHLIIAGEETSENKHLPYNRSPETSSRPLVHSPNLDLDKINLHEALSSKDFALSPEQALVLVNKSHAKILALKNTPSPEKRNVEGQTPTLTKKQKTTPESDIGQSEIGQDLRGPNLRTSADDKTLHTPQTLVETPKRTTFDEKGGKSTIHASPMLSNTRKRKIISSFGISKTTNDSCESKSWSPPSDATTVHKSPSLMETQEAAMRAIEESKSATEGKTVKPLRDPPNLQSPANHSNSDDLHPTRSLSETEEESPLNLTVSKRTSSTSLNLQRRKQNDAQSVSDLITESILPPFVESSTSLHPTTITDECVSNPNKDAAKTKETQQQISDILIVEQHNISETASLYTKHSKTDKMPVSNIWSPLNPHKCTSESVESYIKINKSYDHSSVYAKNSQSTLTDLENLDNKANSNQNLSCCLTDTSTTYVDSKKSTPQRIRIHRRSLSDESLTSQNVSQVFKRCDQFHSLAMSHSSKPSISSDPKPKTCFVQPLQNVYPRPASNSTLPTSNPPDMLSGRSNQSVVGMAENMSNNLPLTRNISEVQFQLNQYDPYLPSRTRHVSDEASTSRSQPTVRSDINSSYIDIYEGQASTSRHQPLVRARFDSYFSNYYNILTIPPQSSGLNPSNFNVSRESPSISENQPSNTNQSSPTNPRPTTDDDDSSNSSSDDSNSVNDSEIPFAPSRLDFLPVYVSEAHLLLQLILREMMLYNDENDRWREFATLFLRYSKSPSDKNRRYLRLDLAVYDVQKMTEFKPVNLTFIIPPFSIKPFLMDIFGRLIWRVVNTLEAFSTEQPSLDFEIFIEHYRHLRLIQTSFSQYWQEHTIDIEEETSRTKLTNLKKMIQRLLLTASMAFRLMFIHIGANAEERIVEIYTQSLSEEDKIYLGRN